MPSSGQGATRLRIQYAASASKVRMPPYEAKYVALRVHNDALRIHDAVLKGHDADLGS